jgi:sterol desaturase/sphingolipid hydroxylase (fatty acid hydroxylase superfamily)
MGLTALFDRIATPLFGGLFLLCLWLEWRQPLRLRVQSWRDRLITNLAVAASASVPLRLVLIPVVVWVAEWGRGTGFGLLRLYPLPPVVAAVAGFLLMDYTTYLWHRLNHGVPLLWRFHAMHHTDLDLDVSTAFRFHFGELLLSVGYRTAQVSLLGVAPALAIAYEIAMEAAAEFHHSNWRLPLGLERALNRLIVTPRMHGIHHSIVERETNANWSVIFNVWDRLHRTLRLGVAQADVTIGLPAYRDARELGVWSLLALPFRGQRPTWQLPDGRRPERLVSGDPRQLAP